jgi:hypothetical protein
VRKLVGMLLFSLEQAKHHIEPSDGLVALTASALPAGIPSGSQAAPNLGPHERQRPSSNPRCPPGATAPRRWIALS